MLSPIAAVILALVFLGIGIGIAEYYHTRIDKARLSADKPDLSDMFDISHPAPQPVVLSTQDYSRQKRAGARV